MAQLLVRHVDDEVAARLKQRAKRHGRSTEEEIRHILRDATKGDGHAVRKLGSRIADRFRDAGLTAEVVVVRQRARPARLDT
jgi:plasmid stability protein